jgi:hypothetical protein
MAHAFFSPSSAPRVVACPGSLLLTHGMPDQQSIDAAHGTAAHWIGDLCLKNGCKTERYAGCEIAVAKDGKCCFVHDGNRSHITLETAFGNYFLFECDDEMVVAVQDYVDWCNEPEGDKYTECRVDISRWTPDQDPDDIFATALLPQAFEPQFGTSDHATCRPRKLIITDLKYGKGVKVYAEKNEQAILYALGFIDEWNFLYDFEEVEIRICQPRLDHKDVWVTTVEEIQKIGAWIKERFTLALMADAPFGPGEKACKFCKASGQCRAQADWLSKIRALAFDNLDTVEPLLTVEELVEAYKAHKLYMSRFDAIQRELERRLKEGLDVPVEAKTHRKWINQAEAAVDLEWLGVPKDKLYTEVKIISPAQAEKFIPAKDRKQIGAMIYKPRGDACIADADDKRPVYTDAGTERVNEVFDDLDDPFA